MIVRPPGSRPPAGPDEVSSGTGAPGCPWSPRPGQARPGALVQRGGGMGKHHHGLVESPPSRPRRAGPVPPGARRPYRDQVPAPFQGNHHPRPRRGHQRYLSSGLPVRHRQQVRDQPQHHLYRTEHGRRHVEHAPSPASASRPADPRDAGQQPAGGLRAPSPARAARGASAPPGPDGPAGSAPGSCCGPRVLRQVQGPAARLRGAGPRPRGPSAGPTVTPSPARPGPAPAVPRPPRSAAPAAQDRRPPFPRRPGPAASARPAALLPVPGAAPRAREPRHGTGARGQGADQCGHPLPRPGSSRRMNPGRRQPGDDQPGEPQPCPHACQPRPRRATSAGSGARSASPGSFSRSVICPRPRRGRAVRSSPPAAPAPPRHPTRPAHGARHERLALTTTCAPPPAQPEARPPVRPRAQPPTPTRKTRIPPRKRTPPGARPVPRGKADDNDACG